MTGGIDNSLSLEVKFEELDEDVQKDVQQALDLYKHKCMLSFSRNKSNKILQKTYLPRVLLDGENDYTEDERNRRLSELIDRSVGQAMNNHNTTFLNTFRHILIQTFGPEADKLFEEAAGAPGGPVYFQLQRNDGRTSTSNSAPQNTDTGPIVAEPTSAAQGANETQLANQGTQPITHGTQAFGTTNTMPASALKVAPYNSRLQRNPLGSGYHGYTDYSAINALPNPGYGNNQEQHAGGQAQGHDMLLLRMADMMQNQFGLKPKNQARVYRPPYPEWFDRVSLPPRVKVPTEFTKFSGQDDTSTHEHISRYLIQLGEASTEDAWRVRYFPLSLTGPAFTWFTSLGAGSVNNWNDLEQKFHAYFYTGTNEKKLVDLMSLRQRINETPLEYLKRFREVKNLCYSLDLPDDQLPEIAIAGMQPMVKEKLFGMDFEDLGQLSHRLSTMNSQAQGFKKDTRFQKSNAVVDVYEYFLEKSTEYEDEDEVAAAEINWAKDPTMLDPRWARKNKGSYDFDVTKADRLFEVLLKERRIKLPEGHSMLRPEGVKDRKYCGYHDTRTHSINDCRVFRAHIQKAIQEGHLKFSGKMTIDTDPFPQNMIGFSVNAISTDESESTVKVKVLTSEKAKENGSVDPKQQVTKEQLQKRVQFQNSRTMQGDASRPKVTSRILLNKWQRQQEKDYYLKKELAEDGEQMKQEYQRYQEEKYRKKQAEYLKAQEQSHWGCAFFRHYWNEGLKLPSRNNCPECSEQYSGYRQSRVNRRSVHERLGNQFLKANRRIKEDSSGDYPKKRFADQSWVDHERNL